MVRILVGLWAIALDEQSVVSISLDVEVTIASEIDHFHREVMWHAVIEDGASVRHPDLGALVADDGTVEAEPLGPWEGAGKRPRMILPSASTSRGSRFNFRSRMVPSRSRASRR